MFVTVPYLLTNVSFIPYFHLLVFGILVTLLRDFLSCFFCLAHLALQNVNKDYIIFLYCRNFVAKSDQKQKIGWTKHKKDILLYKYKRLRLNSILKPYSQFYFADPRCWLREDVQTWIRHLAAVHGLPAVQPDRFLMNGKALCLMTMEMFCQRVPLGGKMLYKDFQLRLSMALYGNNNKCWKTRIKDKKIELLTKENAKIHTGQTLKIKMLS